MGDSRRCRYCMALRPIESRSVGAQFRFSECESSFRRCACRASFLPPRHKMAFRQIFRAVREPDMEHLVWRYPAGTHSCGRRQNRAWTWLFSIGIGWHKGACSASFRPVVVAFQRCGIRLRDIVSARETRTSRAYLAFFRHRRLWQTDSLHRH